MDWVAGVIHLFRNASAPARHSGARFHRDCVHMQAHLAHASPPITIAQPYRPGRSTPVTDNKERERKTFPPTFDGDIEAEVQLFSQGPFPPPLLNRLTISVMKKTKIGSFPGVPLCRWRLVFWRRCERLPTLRKLIQNAWV